LVFEKEERFSTPDAGLFACAIQCLREIQVNINDQRSKQYQLHSP